MGTGMMTNLLYGLFYLAVLLLVVGAAVYLFITRRKGVAQRGQRGSVADLPWYVAQLASSSIDSYLTAELESTGDSLLMTKDSRGVNLQFDQRSPLENFASILQSLASREGLTLVTHKHSFPEINIPPETTNPEAITYRLFCGIYNARKEDVVDYDLGSFTAGSEEEANNTADRADN